MLGSFLCMNLRLRGKWSVWACEALIKGLHRFLWAPLYEAAVGERSERWNECPGVMLRAERCADLLQGDCGEVKCRYVTAGWSIWADVFFFSASFAIIFTPRHHNVPIHLWANGTLTAEIAAHCTSYLFTLNKEAEMACGLSGVGDNYTRKHITAAVLRCTRACGPWWRHTTTVALFHGNHQWLKQF